MPKPTLIVSENEETDKMEIFMTNNGHLSISIYYAILGFIFCDPPSVVVVEEPLELTRTPLKKDFSVKWSLNNPLNLLKKQYQSTENEDYSMHLIISFKDIRNGKYCYCCGLEYTQVGEMSKSEAFFPLSPKRWMITNEKYTKYKKKPCRNCYYRDRGQYRPMIIESSNINQK